MINNQIALSALFSIGGIGLILIIFGVLVKYFTNKRNNLCTFKTEGIVKEHRYNSRGNIYPVIEFNVDEDVYQTRKKFNARKIIHIGILKVDSKMWEDDKGNLCIKTGSSTNMKKLAEELWPLGSNVTVYYNLDDPNMNYVDRPTTNSFIFIMFVLMGLLCIGIGILIFFLIL